MYFQDIKLGDYLHDMRMPLSNEPYPLSELSQPHRVVFAPMLYRTMEDAVDPGNRQFNPRLIETMVEVQCVGKYGMTRYYDFLYTPMKLTVVATGSSCDGKYPAVLVAYADWQHIRFGTVSQIDD